MSEESDKRNMVIIEDDEAPRPMGRWVPLAVVTGVVGGFIALAWYAYHSGMQSMKEEDLLVVEADKTPMKEKPADPGGMQFPNQDKTIFDTFSGNAPPPSRVERVLPLPEEPTAREADASGTTGWISDKGQKNNGGTQAAPAPAEQVIGSTSVAPAAPAVSAPMAAAPQADSGHGGNGTAQADAQSMTYIAPAAVKPAEEKPVPAPAVPARPAKPSAKEARAVASGPMAQLGAYRSDKEAREAWEKMQKKQPALAGKEPVIVRADLGGKGIYYRLRVGGFSSASEAMAFCGKLTGGQACLLPGGK